MSQFIDDELSDLRVNLDKLHLEKTELDKELENLVSNRKSIEQNVERARTKRNQVLESHIKMQDALKMTRFKMEMVESKIKTLEDKSGGLGENINRIQSDLELELQRQDKDLVEFEAQMKQLSYLFLNAVTFYTTENLEEENVKSEREVEELEQKLAQVVGQVEILDSEFANLVSKPSSDPWDLELPLEHRRIVLKMFQDEHRILQQTLSRVLQERSSLQEEIEKLRSS